MTRETFIASDGLRLSFQVDDYTKPWSKARSLVMLHSAMGHGDRYFAMVPKLAANFRVIRPDLRGHGQSDVPGEDKPLTMERLVLDTVELLRACGEERAIFIGNSAGGYIAQNLALSMPERIEAMCLFGSTPGLKNTNAAGWLPQIEKEGLRNFLARTIDYRFDLSVTDPGLVEWFLDEAAKNDINYLARFIGLMSSLDWSDELDRIACPTCLVIPEKEAASGVRNYSAMRERIPDVETVLIEGAAHNICDVIPERCAEIALNFAKRQVHH